MLIISVLVGKIAFLSFLLKRRGLAVLDRGKLNVPLFFYIAGLVLLTTDTSLYIHIKLTLDIKHLYKHGISFFCFEVSEGIPPCLRYFTIKMRKEPVSRILAPGMN